MIILLPILIWSQIDVAEIEAYLSHDEATFKPIFELLQPAPSTHSTVYKWKDFGTALRLMYNEGVAGMKFYLGDPKADPKKRAAAAKVAIAAFLAQSMQETIQYDACDENNWTDKNEVQKNGRPGESYPIDAACGQAKQVYADYKCPAGFEGMECPQVPPGTVMFAKTHAKWYGAPAPLFCAPDSEVKKAVGNSGHKSGRWDTEAGWCNPKESKSVDLSKPPYLRDDCAMYEGQKSGKFTYGAFADKYNSVEGCCWWGRGVIQTTGRGNFGLLNHYLGKGHAHTNKNGKIPKRPSKPLYGNIDFCADPQFICSGDKPELKWIAGLFYWVQSVQAYEETMDGSGWDYYAEVNRFAECGRGTTEFIDAVSAIVNRGCHVPGKCKAGAVHGKTERRKNFLAVLAALDTQIPGGGTPAGNPGDGKCGSAPSPGTPSPGTPSPGTPSPGTPSPSPGTPASSPGTPASSPGTPASSPGTPASSPGTPASSPGTPASSPGTPTPGTPAGTSPGTSTDDGGIQMWHIGLIVVGVVILLLGAFAMRKDSSSPEGNVSSRKPPQKGGSSRKKTNASSKSRRGPTKSKSRRRTNSGMSKSSRNSRPSKGSRSKRSKSRR